VLRSPFSVCLQHAACNPAKSGINFITFLFMASCPNWVNIDNAQMQTQRRKTKEKKEERRCSRKRCMRQDRWQQLLDWLAGWLNATRTSTCHLAPSSQFISGVGYAATSGCQLPVTLGRNNCIVAFCNYANLSELIVYGSSLPLDKALT